MYLGPPTRSIFIETEGNIDEVQCLFQFYVREFHGSARVRHLSDERDERRVVYLNWRAGQGVRPVIVNRILAPIMLGDQQCGEL